MKEWLHQFESDWTLRKFEVTFFLFLRCEKVAHLSLLEFAQGYTRNELIKSSNKFILCHT